MTEMAIKFLCQERNAVIVYRDYLISSSYLLHIITELTGFKTVN